MVRRRIGDENLQMTADTEDSTNQVDECVARLVVWVRIGCGGSLRGFDVVWFPETGVGDENEGMGVSG